MSDIEKFDPDLLAALMATPAPLVFDLIQDHPDKLMPEFEQAAKETARADLLPQPAPEDMVDMQVTLHNFQRFSDIRKLQGKVDC